MPTGAKIYVQVSDTSAYEEIQYWKERFSQDFAHLYGDFNGDQLDEYAFNVATSGNPDILIQGKCTSAWEIFPKSFFLEMTTYPSYFWPGYERGSLAELIEISEWIEKNVSDSIIWYGADSCNVAMPFTKPVREIFQEYFQKIGYAPYEAARSGEENQWKTTQGEYGYKINQAQSLALEELKKSHGI